MPSGKKRLFFINFIKGEGGSFPFFEQKTQFLALFEDKFSGGNL